MLGYDPNILYFNVICEIHFFNDSLHLLRKMMILNIVKYTKKLPIDSITLMFKFMAMCSNPHVLQVV